MSKETSSEKKSTKSGFGKLIKWFAIGVVIYAIGQVVYENLTFDFGNNPKCGKRR